MNEQPKLFENTLSTEKLPTNLTTRRHPVHRWFNFIAGFSPEFVSSCIRTAELDSDEVLIDPFAGLSTSLVQANFEGMRSVGFEAHPFSYDISRAKLFPPEHSQPVDDIEALSQASVEPYTGALTDVWTQDAAKFLAKTIPQNELRFLASALLLENRIQASERPLYRLIISRVLEYAAGSQTDGIYKAPTTKKTSVPFAVALRRVCSEIRSDVANVSDRLGRRATIYPVSSEAMVSVADESCSLCVTSPPYLNNFDFAEMTRMELYFWRYAGSWREITERVRRRLIVNTTTAPTDLKRGQERYVAMLSDHFQRQLEPLVEALEQQRQIRAGKKDYCLLVYPYFAQMQAVIRELRRVLKPESNVHFVVADSALYGVHIRTEKLLAELMRENGFYVLEVKVLRSRGERWKLKKRQGADQPLGEFHVHAKRI